MQSLSESSRTASAASAPAASNAAAGDGRVLRGRHGERGMGGAKASLRIERACLHAKLVHAHRSAAGLQALEHAYYASHNNACNGF